MKQRRIKKNKYQQVIYAELDLHGYTKIEAEAELINFIEDSKSNNYERVRIITGKGVNSKDGIPVLKHFVEAWLKDKRYDFRYAKINEGGEGVIIAELK